MKSIAFLSAFSLFAALTASPLTANPMPKTAPPPPPAVDVIPGPPGGTIVGPPVISAVVSCGTLGQTYHRRSIPIPRDRHPRVAMIEVHGASEMEIVIEGDIAFTGFRGTDGIWRFESDEPLPPCREAIYEVRSISRNQHHVVSVLKVARVRMIPGRLVYLDF